MSKVYSPFYTAELCSDVTQGHRSLCYPGLSLSNEPASRCFRQQNPPTKERWLPRAMKCLFLPRRFTGRKEGCWFSKFDALHLLNALAGLHAEQGIGDYHPSSSAHGWRMLVTAQQLPEPSVPSPGFIYPWVNVFQLDPEVAMSVTEVHSPGSWRSSQTLDKLFVPGWGIWIGLFFFYQQRALRCGPSRGI